MLPSWAGFPINYFYQGGRLQRLKDLGERLRALAAGWGAKLRAATARRPRGLPAIPGQSSTVSGGKLTSAFLKIDWEKVFRKTFTYNSIAAVVCGYFAADLLVAALTPWFPPAVPPHPRLLQGAQVTFFTYANVIVPKGRPNLFNEKGLVPDNDEGGSDLNGPPVKTSLPLNLLGVIVVKDPKKSVASIEDKGANQVIAVRVGEPITRDTEVQSITDDRVIFLNNATGRREYVELPKDQITATLHAAPAAKAVIPGVVKSDDGHVTVSRDALKKALGEDFKAIAQAALCKPAVGQMGFRCTEIEKGSIFEKLGVQDGDVITAIDGETLSSPTIALSKFAALKEGHVQHLSITTDRNGQTITTYFDFE